MSGSPKYTTTQLDAQRRAQLAQARRQREQERRRQREEARQRRLAAEIRAAAARQSAVLARVRRLAQVAQSLAAHSDVTVELARVTELAPATDETSLARVGVTLRQVERRVDALAATVARELTRREHGTALDVVAEQLDSVRERERFDPSGHRSVTALTARARSSLGDAKEFTEIHRQLAAAAGTHLETVRHRQAEVLRLAAESDEVSARLSAVLADAEAAGVRVPGAADARGEAAALRAETDGAHLTRWQQRVAGLRQRVDTVTAQVDEQLDRLDRMAMVVEAASAALPAAGLRVVPDSLVEGDGTVTFLARRADGGDIELTVHGDDGRLEYRADGSDITVERTPDGQVSRCDLTEELLERFHDQLARLGVQTDGLHWHGKPDRPRPPGQAIREVAARDDRGRAAGRGPADPRGPR